MYMYMYMYIIHKIHVIVSHKPCSFLSNIIWDNFLSTTSCEIENINIYNTTCITVLFISSYGTRLAQRASYLAQNSCLFKPDATVNYDNITNSCLLIGSRRIPNGAHTNHRWANLTHASKCIKNSDVYVHVHLYYTILGFHNGYWWGKGGETIDHVKHTAHARVVRGMFPRKF